MITVNLIPQDFTPKQRTPIGQFVGILACVLFVAGSFAAFLYMEYGRLAEVESELSKVKAELELVKPHRVYAEKLQAEKKEFARRTETIQGIGAARVLWSKKLDQFWEVIENKGDAERHNVWINSLSAKSPGKGGKKKSKPGTFRFSGFSASKHSRKLSNFHRDVTESPFYTGGLYDIDLPEGKQQAFNDGLEPAVAWKFDFSMKLRANAPAKKTKKPAKKKPAKKKSK